MARYLAVMLILLWIEATSADLLQVGNHSFESPDYPPGSWGDFIPDWEEDSGAGSNGAFVEYILGFASEGTQHLGINSLPTSINSGIVPPGTYQYTVSQNLGVSLQPNTEYTLTVAIGNRNSNFTLPGNRSIIGLGFDSGVSIVEHSFDASTIPTGTFVDQTVTYTTGETVTSGNLTVLLTNFDEGLATGDVATASRAHFDNVRLTAVRIPEPNSLTLLALIGLGVMVHRRRYHNLVIDDSFHSLTNLP